MKNNDYVTASEIGDYVFCKRGWWLRFNGLLGDTEAMTQGIEQHEKIASNVQNTWQMRNIAFTILLLGLLVLLSAILYLALTHT